MQGQSGPIVRAAGDSAVLLEFGSEIEAGVNERVVGIASALRGTSTPGLLEVMPGYCTLLLRYDPVLTDLDILFDAVVALDHTGNGSSKGRTFVLPVIYGGEFGPDLPALAGRLGLTEAQIVERHSAPVYRIYCLGFSPGFPFLGGLDPSLHSPRLETPRTRVPAGSVAIGGEQTGVYPVSMPGGWHIIGRCPLRLFDPGQDPPVAYGPGDTIRFQPIRADEFRTLEGSPLGTPVD